MKFSTTVLSSLVVGGMLASGLVGAEEAASSIAIKVQDLNLNSTAGAASLYGRIHQAAQTVCGNYGSSRQFSVQEQFKKCVLTAEEGAIRRVNSGTLSAYYQAKTGRSVASMALNVRSADQSSDLG